METRSYSDVDIDTETSAFHLFPWSQTSNNHSEFHMFEQCERHLNDLLSQIREFKARIGDKKFFMKIR